MTQPTGHRPNPQLRSHPVGEQRGSWLLGAVYSMGFYIGIGLLMTLGEGFGGIMVHAWLLVAAAWLVTAGWLIAHRRTRNTGIGMVASVAVLAGVFWLLGLVLALTFAPR